MSYHKVRRKLKLMAKATLSKPGKQVTRALNELNRLQSG